MDEARACTLIRALWHETEKDKVWRIFSQLRRGGMALLSTYLEEHVAARKRG